MRAHRVVIGLLAGLVVGSLINASHSPALLRLIAFVEPVGLLWIGAIRMTVVPLVISLLFASVASHGSSAELGRIGLVTLATFLGLLLISAVVGLFVARPLIDDMKLAADVAASLRATVTVGAVETTALAAKVPSLGSWLTSLVPANVVKAAADGAMLPVIAFTLVFALASRRIDAGLRESLVALFFAIANAMTRIVGWVLTGLFTAFVLMDVGMKLARLPIVEQTGAQLHLPPGSGFPIGVGEALILVLYLVPRTSVLGAVLFTGLFGGTAAVHWLNHDPLFSHVLFGVYLALFAWGGLWLRDAALRALFPVRR